jgi:signal transduction histidine kinase
VPGHRLSRTDALLALGTSALVGAAVATYDGSATQAVLGYCFAAVFGAVSLLTRAWPLPALLAMASGVIGYYLLDLAPIGLVAPTAAALYTAADRGRSRAAALVAGSLLAASVIARLREGDDVSIVLGLDLGSQAAMMVAVIALGDAVRSRRRLRAELARQVAAAAAEREAEAARQVEAERLRIAREVHDSLGHAIAVVTLQSAVAREALDDDEPARAAAALAAIRAAGAGAMAELRATLRTLRREPGAADAMPGLERLPVLVEGVRRGGLPVLLRVDGEVDVVPAVVGTTAFRVVQEALTNVARHARATRVEVTVVVNDGSLSLSVLDDGHGMESQVRQSEAGHGLRGMSERIALLGGSFEVGPAEAGGFRVHAELPLPVAAR